MAISALRVLQQIEAVTEGKTDWTGEDIDTIANNFIVPKSEKNEPTQHDVPTDEPAVEANSETENQNFLTLNDFANMLYGQHKNGEFDEPTIEVYDDRKAFHKGGEILLTLRSANTPELYLQPKYANAKVEEFQCTGADAAKCLIKIDPGCDWYCVTEVEEDEELPADDSRCLETYIVQIAEDAFVRVLYDCIGGIYYIETGSRNGGQVFDIDGCRRQLPFDPKKVMDAVLLRQSRNQ